MRFHTGSFKPRPTTPFVQLTWGPRKDYLPLPKAKPLTQQVTDPRKQRIPYLSQCTSWNKLSTPAGRFSEFLPEAMTSYNKSTADIARTAIAWSSRYYTYADSAELLIRTRKIVDLSHSEVRGHLNDAVSKGGQFHRNAMIRLKLLKEITFRTPTDHPYSKQLENLLRYRKMIAHMGTKIGFIKVNVPEDAIKGKDHPDAVYLRKFHHDLAALKRHLDNPASEVTFRINDGSQAIAIPFGIMSHPIMLVFSKDSEGRYNLRIFNQGKQPDAPPFQVSKVKFLSVGYVSEKPILRLITWLQNTSSQANYSKCSLSSVHFSPER